MKEQHQFIYNLLILDESGSMGSIRDSIISNFNELVTAIKSDAAKFPEQKHQVCFVSFDSKGIKNRIWSAEVEQLQPIDHNSYVPNAATPLFDAMGLSLNKLEQEIKNMEEVKVLVTVLTDGMENASTEFNQKSIVELVKRLKNAGWNFTYIGTDHDVEQVAKSLEIHHHIHFDKHDQGVKSAFDRYNYSRREFITSSREDFIKRREADAYKDVQENQPDSE